MSRFTRKILFFCVAFFCLAGFAEAADRVYRQGDQAPEIALIQTKLKEQGYIIGKPDGFFSWETTHAVKVFQRNHRLKADGVVDATTYRRLMGKPFPPELRQTHGSRVVWTAKQYVGVPYKFGGDSPKGFDCSGYVCYVFKQHGRILPRAADQQYKTGKFIAKNQLQQGDIVFFTTYEPGVSHNGIYIGNGEFIHASSSRGVMISKLDETYWKPRYLGSRRVL